MAKICLSVVLSAVLVCFCQSAEARVRQTADAVIIEAAASDDLQSMRKDRAVDDDAPGSTKPATMPGGTFMLDEKTCWTPDGLQGTCGTVRSCYPNVRLPPLSSLETWVIGTRGTCHYAQEDGRQVYGLCCPKKTASPFWPFFVFPSSAPAVPAVDSAKSGCGVGPYKTLTLDEQSRIVGGTTAVRNSWPFIASMQSNGRHFCGASLMDSTHVLTAAHCVAHMTSFDVAKLEVAFAMHDLKPADPAAVKKKVRRVTRHKGYDAKTMYNDIAILTLDSPIGFGPTISPVCLPPAGSNEQYVNSAATVIGWGTLKQGGSLPSALQQVTVQVKTNGECKSKYGASYEIVDHMLCAASPGKDSCQGDSGGPLIVQSNPGAPWVQVGVVSWGIGCADSNYPGVYARVTSFMDWIGRNSV